MGIIKKSISVLNILYWLYNFIVWGIIVPYGAWGQIKILLTGMHPIFRIFTVIVLFLLLLVFIMLCFRLAIGENLTFRIVGALYGIITALVFLFKNNDFSIFTVIFHSIPILFLLSNLKQTTPK